MATTTNPNPPVDAGGRPASWVNIMLGTWLFISAFIWPHGYASMTNTWIVGLAIFVVAIVGMYAPWARYVNTAIAIYLFICAFAFPHATAGTMWNNAIVAILVFLASLAPAAMHPAGPRRLAHA